VPAQQINVIKVHLTIKKRASLASILSQVEAQTAYQFIYDPKQLEGVYKKMPPGTVDKSLAEFLSGLGCAWLISGKMIILKPPADAGVTTMQPERPRDTAFPMQMLNEVYVIGYGSIEPGKVSSSLSKVKSGQFHKGSSTSPLDLIRGKVAGLSVTRAGGNNNPNQVSAVQLRGVTTLSTYDGANQPLIVVDGIPGGSLDLLQQDDIAAFDVLKDGAAAAIYGTRGSPGVILVTTKQGRPGVPAFEYSSYVSVDQLRKRPEVLSAARYRQLMNDPANEYRGIMIDYGGDEDYYDQLINKKNLTNYHYFAASGGTEFNTYRASVYLNTREGIARDNGNRQYGGRVSLQQKSKSSKMSLQVNLAANIREANQNGGILADFEQAVQQNPTQPVHDSSGGYFYTNGSGYYNPVARLNEELHTTTTQTLAGDVNLVYRLLPGLEARVRGAFYQQGRGEDNYYTRASKRSIDSYRGAGYAEKLNYNNRTLTFETTLDYHLQTDKHYFNAIAGYSYQRNVNQYFSAGNSGFLSDNTALDNIGSGVDLASGNASMDSHKTANKLIAFFGRLSYVYDNKYVASATFRHEGSSRFGDNHKWGAFPALSVAWNMEQEAFLQPLRFINKLKLRAGYGVTGNQTIPEYQSLVTLGMGGQYLNNGIWFQTYGPNKNPNADLRWEKKKEINLGLDFELCNHRVSGSLDLYRRLTSDLLANYSTQVPSFVLPTIYTNVGSIENRGIELSLHFQLLKKRDVEWNMEFVGSAQQNKLASLSDDVFRASYFQFGNIPAPGSLGFSIRAEEGMPLGSFYGKRFAGFTADGKWLFYKADGSTGTAAEMGTQDQGYIGNGVPRYMLSLGSAWRYKNLELSVFFRSKLKFDILNLQNMFYGNRKRIGNNILDAAFTRYKDLNDDPQYSDYYLEKGDFLKIDNVTLGYNFNMTGTLFSSLRCYASVQNLAVITGYSGMDPETEDTGLTTGLDSRGGYPPTRTFTFGLNLSF
jgi:TonB-linked SusC/RagA family outer membrane protein